MTFVDDCRLHEKDKLKGLRTSDTHACSHLACQFHEMATQSAGERF